VDGRRICQYGHVNESHVEINDEEDDANGYVITRRLNIPNPSQSMPQASQLSGSQIDEKKRKFYGAKARELFFKSFQAVIRAQVRILIQDQGAPQVLETVVKRLWIEYLSLGLNTIDGTDTEFSIRETGTTGTESEQRLRTLRKLPKFIDSLALCYLGCRYLNLPIYLNDFIVLTTTNRIPYMKASTEIPKTMRQKLPTHMLNSLESRKAPLKGDLCDAVANVAHLLSLEQDLNYEPLLFKIVNELILPPEIYTGVKRYIKQHDINFEIPAVGKKSLSVVRKFPEIKLISIVISVTKLYYLHSQSHGTPYHWSKWIRILSNRDLSTDENRNFNNLLTSLLLSDTSEQEIVDWDDSQTEKYLDWFSKRIMQPQLPSRDDLPVSLRRLYGIFELPEESDYLPAGVESSKIKFSDLITETISEPSEVSIDDLNKIETLLCENFIVNFGITMDQLRQSVRFIEASLAI
jgi:RNA polymerase I-specific transcription initiation factor RRN7